LSVRDVVAVARAVTVFADTVAIGAIVAATDVVAAFVATTAVIAAFRVAICALAVSMAA
jgi:hypothetical protein